MATTCNTVMAVPNAPNNCCEITLSGCVFYDGIDLSCVKIPRTAYLNDVIKSIDEAICANTSNFGVFDYKCLSSLNIKTEKEFVEKIVGVICEMLGTQVPGTITSLSQLYALIQDLQTQINTLNSPPLVACFKQLMSLGANPTLHQLVSSIQSAICNLDQRIKILEAREDVFVKVSGSDTTTGYLDDKLIVDPNLVKTIINQGGNEKIKISIDYVGLLNTIKNDSILNTMFCNMVSSCGSCVEVNCINCNGSSTACPQLTYGTISKDCINNTVHFEVNGWNASMGTLSLQVKGDSTVYTSTNGIFDFPIKNTWTVFNYGVNVWQLSPFTSTCNSTQLLGGDSYLQIC
jgi:hypothetical protein